MSVGADHESVDCGEEGRETDDAPRDRSDEPAGVPHEVRIIRHANPRIHVKVLGLLNRMFQLATSYKSVSANDFLHLDRSAATLAIHGMVTTHSECFNKIDHPYHQ